MTQLGTDLFQLVVPLTPWLASEYDERELTKGSIKEMGNLGVSELVIILLIVIVIFGATRLPQLGKGLGEGIRNFKSSLKTGDDVDDVEEEAK